MIGKKMRRLTGLLAALVLFACAIIPTTAFGDTTATAVGDEYYEQTLGIAETPSLTLTKYQSQEGNSSAVDKTKPIQGVKFKYAKVGGLYQVETGSDTVMAYGISAAFGQAIGLDSGSADYTCQVGSVNYLFFEDGEIIQTATRQADADKLATDYLQSAPEVATDENGQIVCVDPNSATGNEWGLYLIVETDVSGATDPKNGGKPLSITKVQTPFLIALPTMVSNTWDATIEAEIKNATDDAEVEKKIIVNETGHVGAVDKLNDTAFNPGDLDDTDTTSIGDTVWYRLKSTVPAVPTNGQNIAKYVLSDVISKGLTVDQASFEVVTWDGKDEAKLTEGEDKDYTLDFETSIADPNNEKAFEGGSSFTITFTKGGRTKLDALAQDTDATARDVYVRYSATVNNQAVIGPKASNAADNSGNPNEVKLTYQVDGSAVMNTEFDRVTHFTFGIDVKKELQGNNNPGNLFNNVKFKVYTEEAPGGNKTYYVFTGSNGVYKMAGAPGVATGVEELSPNTTDGTIKIDGLELGTYYLEETATAEGYRLLNAPVEFKVESTDKAQNNFVGNASQYLGTLKESTSGRLSATVVNTKGFTLPDTGDSGMWICVFGGIAIAAAGCMYFLRSRKNDK